MTGVKVFYQHRCPSVTPRDGPRVTAVPSPCVTVGLAEPGFGPTVTAFLHHCEEAAGKTQHPCHG